MDMLSNKKITRHQQCHATRSVSWNSISTEPQATVENWVFELLKECARAVSDKDASRVHHLLCLLNAFASPYGDCDQKIASYFLQALLCKATCSGRQCHETLFAITERNLSFDSASKLMLKFQELSPWTTFGHVASNGAILEALYGETKLHIVDISNTLCTQWPTLLESLANRKDETPRLKLTVIVISTMRISIMEEIGKRIERFAGLMRVPFAFSVISRSHRLTTLTREELGIQADEALAINCNGEMRLIEVEKRNDVIRMFHSLQPRVVTIVEEEADFTSARHDFVRCFEECLRYYTLYFQTLEETFSIQTSSERFLLERQCARNIISVLACDHEDRHGSSVAGGHGDRIEERGDCEINEKGTQWIKRFSNSFSIVRFSPDVIYDVKALLNSHKSWWAVRVSDDQGDEADAGICLTWKHESVIWASAWKPKNLVDSLPLLFS